MSNSDFRTAFRAIWRVPLWLALSTLFGLLAALLGTGIWHLLSWLAMGIPLVVLSYRLWVAIRKAKNRRD